MQSFYLAMGGLTLTALVAMADGDTVPAEAEVPPAAHRTALTDTLADPEIVFSENPEQAAADKALYSELVAEEPQTPEFAEEPVADEPQPQPTNRSKYLELLRRKAELMTDEQIDAELREVTADIGELEASRKLEHVMTELQALVSEHPNSVAGQKARRMVEMASAPILHDNGDGVFRRTYEERAPIYPAPSRASDDASFQPSPSRPTPAQNEFQPK